MYENAAKRRMSEGRSGSARRSAFGFDGAAGVGDKVVRSSPKTYWLRMNASVLERVAARLSRAESEGTLWRELGRPLSLTVVGLKPVCLSDYRMRRYDADRAGSST